MDLPFQPPLAPMEAKSVASIPSGDGWQYEPKWDGFRAIGFRDHDRVFISSRKELPLGRYFPEVVEAVKTLEAPRAVVDGEVVRFTDDGAGLDFDALQLRLHPAESRVRMLSEQIPASFIAFDLLALEDRDLRSAPLSERRALLEEVMAEANPPLFLSPRTQDLDVATGWLRDYAVEGLDGVVAKRLDSVYRPGEREMRKVKRERTADCVVLGFRWAKDFEGTAVGSLLLGLYGDDDEVHQVGFTSGFSRDERKSLVEVLRPYMEGRSQGPPPGMNAFSRWNREKDLSYEILRPELVAEVAFDQVTGHRIRHGARFVRWRHDKPAASCRYDQLEQPATIDLRAMLE
jgi:ATP-dependent DNA ligase